MFEGTRRQIVQMLGFSPVILPRLGEAGIRHAITAGSVFEVGSGIARGPSTVYGDKPEQPARPDSWRGKIYEALNQLGEHEYILRETMKNGFDPDIAAYRSTSHSYKMLQQSERLKQRADFQREIRRILDNPTSHVIESVLNAGQNSVGG